MIKLEVYVEIEYPSKNLRDVFSMITLHFLLSVQCGGKLQ